MKGSYPPTSAMGNFCSFFNSCNFYNMSGQMGFEQNLIGIDQIIIKSIYVTIVTKPDLG